MFAMDGIRDEIKTMSVDIQENSVSDVASKTMSVDNRENSVSDVKKEETLQGQKKITEFFPPISKPECENINSGSSEITLCVKSQSPEYFKENEISRNCPESPTSMDVDSD